MDLLLGYRRAIKHFFIGHLITTVLVCSRIGPDVCTILAADSGLSTSEHSVSLTGCRRHDRHVPNALFDARSATDVRHAAVVSLEALHTFVHAFGPHRKHHVCIVEPRNSHVVSRRPTQGYLLLQKTLIALRSRRWRTVRIPRKYNIGNPWKSPQSLPGFTHRSTLLMELRGMSVK